MGKKKNSEAAATEKEAATAARREAVQHAIGALGEKASLSDLAAWVKENTGLDVDNRQVGLFRYHMSPKKAKARKKRGRKKAHAAQTSNGPAPTAKSESKVKGMVAVHDLRVVKELVGRYGPAQIRELIDFVHK
jgi:hypothetical protein